MFGFLNKCYNFYMLQLSGFIIPKRKQEVSAENSLEGEKSITDPVLKKKRKTVELNRKSDPANEKPTLTKKVKPLKIRLPTKANKVENPVVL